MMQHLRDYCQLADHIHCLSPALITGKAKDGERWIERVDGKQTQYYYVQSVKAVAESAGHEPKQAILQL